MSAPGVSFGFAEQVSFTNQDIEGMLRGFSGPEASVGAVVGGVVAASLFGVETTNRLVNTAAKIAGGVALYLTYKASERAVEATTDFIGPIGAGS